MRESLGYRVDDGIHTPSSRTHSATPASQSAPISRRRPSSSAAPAASTAAPADKKGGNRPRLSRAEEDNLRFEKTARAKRPEDRTDEEKRHLFIVDNPRKEKKLPVFSGPFRRLRDGDLNESEFPVRDLRPQSLAAEQERFDGPPRSLDDKNYRYSGTLDFARRTAAPLQPWGHLRRRTSNDERKDSYRGVSVKKNLKVRVPQKKSSAASDQVTISRSQLQEMIDKAVVAAGRRADEAAPSTSSASRSGRAPARRDPDETWDEADSVAASVREVREEAAVVEISSSEEEEEERVVTYEGEWQWRGSDVDYETLEEEEDEED